LSKDPNVKLILWSGCFKDVFNEYIKIENLISASKIYAKAIYELARA
jgi:hypothetical protein